MLFRSREERERAREREGERPATPRGRGRERERERERDRERERERERGRERWREGGEEDLVNNSRCREIEGERGECDRDRNRATKILHFFDTAALLFCNSFLHFFLLFFSSVLSAHSKSFGHSYLAMAARPGADIAALSICGRCSIYL